MNILITGGAGYIGSHIVEKLVKIKSNKIYIIDNLSTGYTRLVNKKAKFIKGNINNQKLLKKIINKDKIHTIIHLAASLNISEAEKNKKKYTKNNIEGTKNLILSCKNSNVKMIIFSSSCSIYGNINGKVNETNQTNPKGYYAFTKLKGERLIIKYAKKLNYKFGIFRYFNVAGASLSGKIGEIEKSHGHLIKNLAIQATKKNSIINIFGKNYKTKDGTCIRDYIHVSDLVDIHIKGIKILQDKKKSFIVNCGYGRGYSVLDIVKIFKKYKKKVKVNFVKKRPGDVAKVFSNTTKLRKMMKWKPRFNDINLILKSSIDWEKKLNKLKK